MMPVSFVFFPSSNKQFFISCKTKQYNTTEQQKIHNVIKQTQIYIHIIYFIFVSLYKNIDKREGGENIANK